MQKYTRPYSIGAAAKAANVTQKQIRNWERRGYIRPAERVACGVRRYRYFSGREVERIRAIKALLDQGYTLSHAAATARNPKPKEVLLT
jgi:DNA-binding transcriptional MerR regulator